ncbi:MAG: response regulator transcription factor [Burkholderiales bacterium]|nr:response regulator transcription factor [Burkholderiales bacterium]
MARLLIIDDHPLFLQGLAALLKEAMPGAELLCVPSAAQALEIAREPLPLDGILLDLSLPDSEGIVLIPELRRLQPHAPIAIVSARESREHIRAAFRAGVQGYIFKSQVPEHLAHALQAVFDGNLVVPPGHEALLREVPTTTISLSRRHLDVLRLMSDGMGNRSIADKLHLSEKTVKNHIGAIFESLCVVNRVQAINEARLRGFID